MGRITEVFRLTPVISHIDRTFGWVAPFGASNAQVILIGPGGGGGSANANGGRGGGGGGGAFAMTFFDPIPGASYELFLGIGGASNGVGNDPTFKDPDGVVICKAVHATAGGSATTGSLSGTAGTGGLAANCIGDTVFDGGDGGPGSAAALGNYSGSGGGAGGTSGPGGDAPTPCTVAINQGCPSGVGADLYGGDGAKGLRISSTNSGQGPGASTEEFGGGGAGGAANSTTLRAGGIGGDSVGVIMYDLSDAVGTGPSPASLACDGITGGDDADIEGRAFDGCGGSPPGVTWERDDVYNVDPSDVLLIKDGNLIGNHDFEIAYNLAGAPPCVGDLHTQAARCSVRYPTYDTVSVPPSCNLIYEDAFDGPEGPLEGRVHDGGGSAGTATYQRIENDSDVSSPQGAHLSGTGYAHCPTLGQAGYRLQFSGTLPDNYEVVCDIERGTEGSGLYGDFGVTLRGQDPYPPPPGHQGRSNMALLYASMYWQSPCYAWWTGWSNGPPLGNVSSGSCSYDPPGDNGLDVGEEAPIWWRFRKFDPIVWTYWHKTRDVTDTPCSIANWYQSAGTKNCQFGTACLPAIGDMGIRWTGFKPLSVEPGDLAYPNCYHLKRLRIYQNVPGISGEFFTDGYPFFNLRWNQADGTGYQVLLEGILNAPGDWDLFVTIYCIGGASFTGQLRNERISALIPRTREGYYIFDAMIQDDLETGHPTIYAMVNGVVVAKFDLISDIPSSSPGFGPIGADPGNIFTDDGLEFGIYDASYKYDNSKPSVLVNRVEVLCPSPPSAFPCSGNPQNPYPNLPPPWVIPAPFNIQVRAYDVFRSVPMDKVLPRSVNASRIIAGAPPLPPMVRAFDSWRTAESDTGELPPWDTGDIPPYFDPCEQLTPPPVGDVEPIPLTGRFIGAQAFPVTMLGPIANGSKRSAVGASSTLKELQQAAARASTIMGGQGNYPQYLLNGHWDRDFFVDTTYAHLSPMLSALQDYTTAGTFFGYSAIDDFDSPRLWPPSGVPDADMVYVFNALHSLLTGIRLGMRGRPSQFGFDPGVDFYEAQYKSWMGLTPEQFTDLEYGASIARGSFCCLNLNYLHGGNGSSGVRFRNNTGLGQSEHNFMCSPAEVVDYLTRMFARAESIDSAQHMPGSVGYMYDPTWLSYPGMIDALTTVRNYMASSLTPL